jgi:hypothetical protein
MTSRRLPICLLLLLVSRRAAFIVIGLAMVSAATAQPDTDLLSKADAAHLFGMTQRRWQANVIEVVRAGAGTGVGDAMTVKTPDGSVTTLLVYAQSPARPSRLEITVAMDAAYTAGFTEAMVADLMAEARRQMAPEYAVDGGATRAAGGGMQFFFVVSEVGRRR